MPRRLRKEASGLLFVFVSRGDFRKVGVFLLLPVAYFPSIIEFIDACAREELGKEREVRMLELGNQIILHEFWGKRYTPEIPAPTGKAYYEAKGFHHTSIDLNGEDGAVPMDLSQPLRADLVSGEYDLITNAGTTEHIEPLAGQYECFKTIHALCAPGGLMLHIVPGIEDLKGRGYWKYHCNNYYSAAFFRFLADRNGYRIVRAIEIESLLAVCLQKQGSEPFMTDVKGLCRKIHRRPWGLIYPGVNDAALPLLSRWLRGLFDRLRDRHDRKITAANLRARAGRGLPT